jgi:hypothetical protein
MQRAPCAFCGHELDPAAVGVYQWISGGWLKNRDGGGAHGVSLPERENKFAHGICVDRATRGWLTQAELFKG